MTRDAQASLRMPTVLKREIQKIATETRRTLSNTIEQLLWRGVQSFNTDGVLVDRPETSKPQSASQATPNSESERLANEMAELVMKMALQKVRERKAGGGGDSGPPKKRRGRQAA